MKSYPLLLAVSLIFLSGCFSNQSFVRNSKDPSTETVTSSRSQSVKRPKDFLEELHEIAECYVVTGNGMREKYLINHHTKKSLLVRTKKVFKVAGIGQRGNGEIREQIIRPGEKVNVGCEGWGMDGFTGLYSIYRHNVSGIFFLKE